MPSVFLRGDTNGGRSGDRALRSRYKHASFCRECASDAHVVFIEGRRDRQNVDGRWASASQYNTTAVTIVIVLLNNDNDEGDGGKHTNNSNNKTTKNDNDNNDVNIHDTNNEPSWDSRGDNKRNKGRLQQSLPPCTRSSPGFSSCNTPRCTGSTQARDAWDHSNCRVLKLDTINRGLTRL